MWYVADVACMTDEAGRGYPSYKKCDRWKKNCHKNVMASATHTEAGNGSASQHSINIIYVSLSALKSPLTAFAICQGEWFTRHWLPLPSAYSPSFPPLIQPEKHSVKCAGNGKSWTFLPKCADERRGREAGRQARGDWLRGREAAGGGGAQLGSQANGSCQVNAKSISHWRCQRHSRVIRLPNTKVPLRLSLSLSLSYSLFPASPCWTAHTFPLRLPVPSPSSLLLFLARELLYKYIDS